MLVNVYHIARNEILDEYEDKLGQFFIIHTFYSYQRCTSSLSITFFLHMTFG
jgi:hypothetical protein